MFDVILVIFNVVLTLLLIPYCIIIVVGLPFLLFLNGMTIDNLKESFNVLTTWYLDLLKDAFSFIRKKTKL